ncbi:MAG: PEGA domain-containing protein [Proteobacteria bacterium]|nr:PEGA domain-containing protein [Pseudomonadota bacterium]
MLITATAKYRCGIKTVVVIPFFFIAILFFSLPCYAGQNEHAKEKFLKGAELFSKEDYSSALATFKESYNINPKFIVLFNIAMCHRALFQNAEAIEVFNRFLKQGQDKIKPNRRNEANSAIKELTLLVGTLKLLDPPDGAELQVDGAVIGTTPLERSLLLNPGQHMLRISLEGFSTLETAINVSVGEETVVQAALSIEDIEAADAKPVRLQTPESTSPVAAPKLNEPVFKSAPDINDSKHEKTIFSGLFVGGLCTGGLGLVGTVIGVYFTGKQDDHIGEINSAFNTYIQNGKNYQDYITYEDTHNRINNNELRVDHIAIAIGYAAGGVLIATGITLIVIDFIKSNRSERDSLSFKPTTNGLSMTF